MIFNDFAYIKKFKIPTKQIVFNSYLWNSSVILILAPLNKMKTNIAMNYFDRLKQHFIQSIGYILDRCHQRAEIDYIGNLQQLS